MDKVEKVVSGLEYCIQGSIGCQMGCPYVDEPACRQQLCRDALEALQPRVLTLEEVRKEDTEIWYNEFKDCEGMLHRDALAVLKPRVLTLDEVIQWEGAFWLEYIEEDSDYLCCWGYAFFSYASQNVIELIVRDGYRPLYSFIRSEYGVRWRCWTSRPTDEQRKATSWQK